MGLRLLDSTINSFRSQECTMVITNPIKIFIEFCNGRTKIELSA